MVICIETILVQVYIHMYLFQPDEEKDDIDLPPSWVSCIEISPKGNTISIFLCIPVC